MLFKPDFPRMKKFNFKGRQEYYSLEKVHKNKEKLQRRGATLRRRGKAMSPPIDDFKIVEKNDYYALYVK